MCQPVYEPPALPVGDDFLGVVHLHGSLTQEPRRLVVTDINFSRANLREAWAARFLERMFASFTVLFVGKPQRRRDAIPATVIGHFGQTVRMHQRRWESCLAAVLG